jgi:hypothetical protein
MHDAPRDEDVVELGRRGPGRRLFGDRFRLPDGRGPSRGWRPSRVATAFAVTALALGLVVGYTAGDRHGRRGAALREPAPGASASTSAAAPAAPFSVAGYSPLDQDSGACSVQSGRHLMLGVQFTNRAPVPLTLRSAKAVLPLGGLTQGTWHWTPCGALPRTLGQADDVLQPGASTWLTMTFTVKVACPATLPVQFTVGYLAQGRSATASLPGFPDLGDVPYAGCPRASPGLAGAQHLTAAPDRGSNASR